MIDLGAPWAEGSTEDLAALGGSDAPARPAARMPPVPWSPVRSGCHVHARLDVPVILSNGPKRRAWVRNAGEMICRPRGWRKIEASPGEPVDCKACIETIAARWPAKEEGK
mgnify:CR=1 FL=1